MNPRTLMVAPPSCTGACPFLGQHSIEHHSTTVECKTSGDDSSCLNWLGTAQEPGVSYVGNLCAASHRVAQRIDDAQPPMMMFEGEHITVQLYTDVFRGSYASNMKWPPPSPIWVFVAVSCAVARFLSGFPLLMPRLADAIIEEDWQKVAVVVVLALSCDYIHP